VAPRLAALIVLLALAGAGAGAGTASRAPASPTVRLIFGGDVMLGRGVAGLARRSPGAVFAGIRFQLASADLTVANLESPLTNRPHLWTHGPNALEAKPETARILKAAGFDALAIANNHAGDAGPQTAPDTMRALAAAGLPVLGAGGNRAAAYVPRILTARGLRIAFLSFDDTGEGPRAGAHTPGVAWWSTKLAHAAVIHARAEADLVVVGIHGGTEYDPTTDPWLAHLGRLLASWGVDIVWGTGPHVVQPTKAIPRAGGGSTIVATSLGNLVFDQSIQGTRTGELLEVLAGRNGVRAYRLGATAQEPSNAVDFSQWRSPIGNAVALDGDWWTLAGSVRRAVAAAPPTLRGFPVEHVVAATAGDPVGDGSTQVAVSFWRPYRRTDVNAMLPRSVLVDSRGLTNHVGIYSRAGRELWVAGTVLTPVRKLAACDGGLALAYTTLNGRTIVGADAWLWHGFGFTPLPALAGPGIPGCADVDGDGRLDPVILGRRT
jgi:poly-gamma-glutamate synthesis protein (capsule biosynthesis protein)